MALPMYAERSCWSNGDGEQGLIIYGKKNGNTRVLMFPRDHSRAVAATSWPPWSPDCKEWK